MHRLQIALSISLPVLWILLLAAGCSQDTVARGPYLGQSPPGDQPQLFAPGIISTGLSVRDFTMTPDGREIYFTVILPNYSHATIAVCRQENGRWTAPEVAPFASDPRFRFIEPHISPDGQKFFFMSTRPGEGQAEQPGWGVAEIWAMDRTDHGWSEPYNLGPPINSEHQEYFPSVTRDGTLYFTREIAAERSSYIYRSRLVQGSYTEPEKLRPEVNSTSYQYNAFIVPDESYLIFSTARRDDGLGRDDYYVCFRSPEDVWTEPINLGDRMNSPGGFEYSAYVSPDGKYVFFTAARAVSTEEIFDDQVTYQRLWEIHSRPENGNTNIYWIDASFIEELRPG
ncbi:MAG: PD40 domain-containing protein [Fidelibacterota bacterium]|nr:MAG: PD40 domain-containing protein [Candidatus Neomarinimicrobiota bacterium]